MTTESENHFNIPRRGNLAAQLLILFVLLLALPNAAYAIRFTHNVDDKWSNPKNWDPEQVPGPGDSAEVTARSVLIDIPVQVANLTFGGPDIYMDGPPNTASSVTVTNRFEIIGGAIRDSGNGSGQLNITISSTATLAFTGLSPFGKFVGGGVTINNAGRIEWSGGPVYFDGILNNSGLFVVSADAGFGSACRCGVINNTGRIEKQAGSGKAQFSGFTAETNSINTTLNNKGVVTVASGSMEIGSGTSTGEFFTAPGKMLLVSLPHTFNRARFTGAGTCSLATSSDFLGTIELKATLELTVESPGFRGGNGGTVKEATFQGGGRFLWKTNGYRSSITGKVTLVDLHSELSGDGLKESENLINQGTMNWLGGAPIGERGAVMRNEGTVNVLAAGTFLGYASNFENVGTVNTFGGGTSASEAATFTNSGVVNIGGFGKAGILQISRSNGFQQTARGALYMEVGGTNAVTPEFDQLTGPAALNGTLNVDVINNFTPPKDTRFVLMTERTGLFARVFTPGGAGRLQIEYPGSRAELVSLSDAPIPLRLWGAGRDLARNESPDRDAEAQAVNATVPQWSYGYRSTAGGTNLTLFTPQQHINDGSGLHGWIAPGQITLGANTKATPIVFNTGSGNYKPLLPDQIYMSPGPNNEFIVARWTAPAAGDYRVAARWVDLDEHGGNGATAYLIKNGQQAITCTDAKDCSFSEALESKPKAKLGRARMRVRTMSLNAGDVLDFVLGSNSESSFDATGFNAAVRRVSRVAITSPANETALNGPQDVTITVNVEDIAPVAKVTVSVDDEENVATATAPPYSLVVPLKEGFHKITAVATDPRQAKVESPEIVVLVAPGAPAAATAGENAKGSSTGVAAATGGIIRRSARGGGADWFDANTWDPKGVPSPNDHAIIQANHAVVITTGGAARIRDLTVNGQLGGEDPIAPPSLDVTGTLYANGQLTSLQLFIQATGKFLNLRNTAVLRYVDITNYGRMVIDAQQFDGIECTIHNFGTFKASPPIGSQAPLNVPLVSFDNSGHSLVGVNTSLSAPAGMKSTGPIDLSPGYAPAISENGAGLVGNDSNSLVGPDGNSLVGLDSNSLVGLDSNSLVGLDSNSLVGNDSNSLLGPDGFPLIGNAGGTLVGNDGNTFVPRRSSSSVSTSTASNGSSATATASPGQIVLAPGAVITGSGELRGDVVNQGGFIVPGNSSGGVVVNGNYTQQSGGTLVLELGGKTFDPFSYDIFQVAGKATLGGNLVVKTINGYVQASGDEVSPLLYSSHTGNFTSVSSNAQLTFGTTGAEVKVSGPNPQGPRALNISTRLQIQSGDNVLFAGFIITGPAGSTKKVLIRGIGPSLAQFGVAGTIPDPFLELHTSSATITNDNYQQAPNKNEIPPAFVPKDSRESVIIATLPPGNYSAILKGAHGETGVGLVEVFDFATTSPAQLANISTRGFVQTDDNVLIGGFIIDGKEPAKVLVLAIGPSLASFGLKDALKDTELELHDSNGGVLSNDDWRNQQETDIIATGLAPTHNKESAVLATLTPGNYTAVVRGKDNTTGIAVVQAYNIQ